MAGEVSEAGIAMGDSERMPLAKLACKHGRYPIMMRMARQIAEEFGFYLVPMKKLDGNILAMWQSDLSTNKGRRVILVLCFDQVRHYSKRNENEDFAFYLRVWIE